MRPFALPSVLMSSNPTEKLVWLYVALNGRGEYSARSLAQELGVDKTSTHSALQLLKEKGLLIERSAPQGRRAGCYEVCPETAGSNHSTCNLRPNGSYSNEGNHS